MDVVNSLSISIGEDNAAHRLLVAAEQLLAARLGNAKAAFVGKLYPRGAAYAENPLLLALFRRERADHLRPRDR